MKTPKLKIVFMGTPEFAVPSLQKLYDAGYDIAAVITQPDRPKGRKRVLTPPPVKELAQSLGIRVLQPEKIRQADAVKVLTEINPELIVTAAYGQILPKSILDLPRLGCVNVHASLLPKYRGAAPIHYAIMNGESETGVTLMYMEEGLDTGEMISRVKTNIYDSDNTGTLFERLSELGAQLVVDTLPQLAAGSITATAQSDDEATYAPMIKRNDEKIDWQQSARQVFNHVRALNPWPGSFTKWEGKVLKIWDCIEHDGPLNHVHAQETPGTVLTVDDSGITVRTGEGAVVLTRVQPAGRKAMPVGDFIQGSRLQPGTVLGGDADDG